MSVDRYLELTINKSYNTLSTSLCLVSCPEKYIEGSGLPCASKLYFGTRTNPTARTRSTNNSDNPIIVLHSSN